MKLDKQIADLKIKYDHLNNQLMNSESLDNKKIIQINKDLSKLEPMISSFSCKIYYPIRKKKDVEFFILNLKKLKKDGN